MIRILPNISSILVDVWIIGYLKIGLMIFRRWILSSWFVDFRRWILSSWFVDFRCWILSSWFKCNDFHTVHCRDLCWPIRVRKVGTKENIFHFLVDLILEILGHEYVSFDRILGLVAISERIM